MSDSTLDQPQPERTKSKAEKLLNKLTSQSCIKKGIENCASRGSAGTSVDSPDTVDTLGLNENGVADAYTTELKMRIASSSAEILENMRRDSGDSNEQSSKVIYSKGDSVGSVPVIVESELKIRPELNQKFRPGVVNQIIENAIKEELVGKEYSADEAQTWAKIITDNIKLKTKEQNFARYKLVVCVVLGERRAQGMSSAYRCLWDAEADCAASYTFTNDSICCVGMVFGVYYY